MRLVTVRHDDVLCRFGGAPKPPPPVVVQAPPTPADPTVSAAADAQAQAAAQAKGRMSTILTSGLGDTSLAQLGKKALLGG